MVPPSAEIYGIVDNPLAGPLASAERMDLDASLSNASPHCGEVSTVYNTAKTFAEGVDTAAIGNGAEKMSVEDIATVNAYTQESPLYGGLNGALGGYGKGGWDALVYYMPYLINFLAAISPLKPLAADGKFVTLYRGVKRPASELLGNLQVGDVLTWWSITSTTTTADVLQSTDFLGIGKAGAKATAGGKKRTVFQIQSFSGINIKPFSGISNEDEVILRPGSRFVIDGITEWHYGVTEVRMHEIEPVPILIGTEAADEDAYDFPTPVVADGSMTYVDMDAYLVPSGTTPQLQTGGDEAYEMLDGYTVGIDL